MSERRRTKLSGLFLIFVTFGLSGCIDFSQQSLTYQHDPETDTLRIYQEYVGIFGDHVFEKSPHDTDEALDTMLTQSEMNQLDSVWRGTQTFFFDTLGLDLEELEDSLRDAASDAIQPTDRLGRDLSALLIGNVRIRNGPFYLDAQGRLCAVQRVTVRSVSHVLSATNAFLRASYEAEAVDESNSVADRARAAAAAADPSPFVSLEGNSLRIRIPGWDTTIGDETEFLRAFRSAGGQITLDGDQAQFGFGSPESARESLTVPMEPGTYAANALRYVRARFGIAAQFDPAADRDWFFVTLPPDRR